MQPQLMICRKQYKNINPFFVGQSVFQVPLTWVFILNLEMTFSHAQIVIIFFMNSCAVGHFEVLARDWVRSDCIMGLFWDAITSVIGCYRFIWVKIRCSLQSHNAVRHNLNLVSRQRPQNCGQYAIHFFFSCPFAQLTFRFIPSSGEIL